MTKTTMKALLFGVLLSSITFAQETNLETKPRISELEFSYKNGDTIVPLKSPIVVDSKLTYVGKTPYPIIFVHGLMSSSETWNTTTNYMDSQYGFVFGGRFDFCLNADNNNIKSNKNFYPTTGADIAAFETTLVVGDYYYVNFNVKIDGSFDTNVLSNQSAIAKQGAAIKKVIERVMKLTGRDKVILVGHSMGGLASREYLQNSYNWQTDGKHHVAKLVFAGTPHAGSNASDNPLAIFTSVNPQSEAVRDLKATYYYSGEKSVFLYGGPEIQNSSSMNDNSYSPDFYNVDIDCNGTSGNTITGLNKKTIDNLVDYSSIIGRITNVFGSNVTTDGVVPEPSSNINKIYTTLSYPCKLFYYNSSYDIIENHTELPGSYYHIMQGLDEPNFKELAYGVDLNKSYNGFTTIQETLSSSDNDFYKFVISGSNTNANVLVTNIITSSAAILNSSGTIVGTTQNSSGGSINFTRTLTPGTYFLKITSNTPNSSTYQTPYNFTINTSLAAKLESSELQTTNTQLNSYPNPVIDNLNVANFGFIKATITSLLGQVVKVIVPNEINQNQIIEMSDLDKGVYLITLQNSSESKTIKIIKN